tara:strand:+ start:162 stop:494 length:333 start_codon:yes stop_codon:yes gene_type:complete
MAWTRKGAYRDLKKASKAFEDFGGAVAAAVANSATAATKTAEALEILGEKSRIGLPSLKAVEMSGNNMRSLNKEINKKVDEVRDGFLAMRKLLYLGLKGKLELKGDIEEE